MPFRIATRYVDMNILIGRMIPYLETNHERLGVSPATVRGLAGLNAPYAKAYEAYADPNRQTKTAREAVDSAYRPLLVRVREIQQSIKKNVEVDLTDEDRNELEIHKDKTTRTRAKVPDFAPINEAIENTALRTKFATRVPSGREIDHFGMPVGAPRLMREIAVTSGDTAPKDKDFYAIDTVGRAEHSVMWPEGDRGKTGWLKTRWANNRGESGPVSETARVMIN